MDEQLKLAHKVLEVANRINCMNLPRYNVYKPESSYAQIRSYARKNEDEKFQQNVYVNYKLEKNIRLPSRMNFVYDLVITNQPT